MIEFFPWSKKLKNKWFKPAIFIFFFSTYLIFNLNLGRDSLFNWDEGIYAELGSELLQSGNLFINTWNYTTWFEKPPGISWLSALGQFLAGYGQYGARLLMPLVATLTLYFIYLVGTKLKNKRVGLMAVGFTLGFNLFLARTRALNTDMPLLLGILIAIYLSLNHSKTWQVALAIAFSVWFKGLAGLLALIIILPLLLSQTKAYLISLFAYLGLFILPWHLYAYFAYGREFYQPYLLEQVISRVTTPIEFHLESRWFYFQYLYQNLGLGIVIVLAFALAYLAYLFFKSRQLKSTHLLVWWMAVPLFIFTLAKTRLFWYILPIYPAIALILAFYLDSFAQDKLSRQVLTILTFGVMLQGIRLAYFSVEPYKLSASPPDNIKVVTQLSTDFNQPLLVLVPPSERTAEAILPADQRISSSFRYGGMPSVVYYYRSPVKFFYNVDKFKAYWQANPNLPVLISTLDKDLLDGYKVLYSTPLYLAIQSTSL